MEKQTHRQMEVKIQPPPPEAAVGMGNEFCVTVWFFTSALKVLIAAVNTLCAI